MRTPEDTINRRLVSSTGVGAFTGDRIYPMSAPSTAIGTDYITYQRVSALVQNTHSTGGPKWQQARVQVDAWSPSYDRVKDLGDEIRKRLFGYRGSTSGDLIWSMTLDSERDLFEGETGDDRRYRVSQDWIVGARVT